jgi:hypothetical protein
MFEKFLSANTGDFRQRYEGTFGFYRDEKGKRLLTKLVAIRGDVCVFVDSKGIEYKLYPDAESDIGFEFIPPKAAYYNTTDGAVLVVRQAARQFQRGLSSKNTVIYTLKSALLQSRVDFPMLEKIHLKAVTPREAYAQWEALPSVAISKQLACDKASASLFVYENKVGSFTKGKDHFQVLLNEPALWRTEVQDAFKSIGCTVGVN